MRLRKFTAWIWTLFFALSALALWKIVVLRWIWRSGSWASNHLGPSDSSLIRLTLSPKFIVPEMLALAIALGYVIGRKRDVGADEIDVAISALIAADFCGTLVLFYVAHATRLF